MVDFSRFNSHFNHGRFDARMQELYPFQRTGVDWLAERVTAYIADEMGLGKSPQLILAADQLRAPFIQVVCPAIAVTDWVRKFERWSAVKRVVYASYNAEPVPPAAVDKYSAIVCGYETAIKRRKLLQANPHGGVLILDEAHYVKNPSAQRTRGFYGKNCSGGTESECISKHFERVWIASGTPVPNGDPREMWPHVHALRPYSILGPSGAPMSYNEWCDEFCVFAPGLGTDKVIAVRNEKRFVRILSDFMIRRTGDVAGLPPVRFALYPMAARNVPRELAIDMWPELADRLHGLLDNAERGDLDAQLEEQMATVRRLTGLLKVEATVEILGEELRSGQLDKVLVFAHHVDVVKAITARLSQFGTGAIYGAISEKERWASIDDFNAGRKRVLVGQLQAASTNVSAPCRHVFFAESSWTPHVNQQAAYRARRIDGHRDPVLARILGIAGTIDDLVQQAAVRKLRQTSLLLPT